MLPFQVKRRHRGILRHEGHTRALGWTRLSHRNEDDKGALSQREAIERACRERGWELLGIHEDNAAAGPRASAARRWRRRAGASTKGEADVLVVARLDRFRSVVDFGQLLTRASKRGWQLRLLSPEVDTSTANGRVMANVLASIAQWEAEIAGERIAAALRARGARTGPARRVPVEVRERIVLARTAGMTLDAIADDLNRDGVPAGQGGEWTRAKVHRVLRQEQTSRP